jgi:hypothetical protein
VSEPERILAAAEAARQRLVDDPLALSARLAEPVAVQDPAGGLDSWFVGLVAEDRLVCFLQLEPDLRVHRYSSFQRRRGSVDGCPPATSWLDSHEVLARARSGVCGEVELCEPVLSYDGSRDRLAWCVPIIGSSAAVYVAGEHANRKDA